MKITFLSPYLFLLLVTQTFLQANTIGYIEDFALAPDRETVLKDLIPEPASTTITMPFMLRIRTTRWSRKTNWALGKTLRRNLKSSWNPQSCCLAWIREEPQEINGLPKEKIGLALIKPGNRRENLLTPQNWSETCFLHSYYQEVIRAFKNLQGFEQRDCVWMQINLTVFNYATFWTVFIQTYGLPWVNSKGFKRTLSRGFGSQAHRNLTKNNWMNCSNWTQNFSTPIILFRPIFPG